MIPLPTIIRRWKCPQPWLFGRLAALVFLASVCPAPVSADEGDSERDGDCCSCQRYPIEIEAALPARGPSFASANTTERTAANGDIAGPGPVSNRPSREARSADHALFDRPAIVSIAFWRSLVEARIRLQI